MTKLTSLPGAENLPGKKESEHLNCYQFDENYCFHHGECIDEEKEGMHPLNKYGFNYAVSQLDQVDVLVDVEKLAEIIISEHILIYGVCDTDAFAVVPIKGLAQALASSPGEWLRLEKTKENKE